MPYSAPATVTSAVPAPRIESSRRTSAPRGLRLELRPAVLHPREIPLIVAVEALMEGLAMGATNEFAGQMVREHLHTGGKRLRARLAIAALDALGGRAELTVPWAAACELLHNATLIHDDVQDGDRTRRGHPTVWARHGRAQAINAGDLLLMLPFLAIDHVQADAELRWTLGRTLATCAAAIARGQTAELVLSANRDATWGAYHHAVAGKTGALFQLPVEGSALMAGRSAEEARWLSSAFQPLGLLFQMQDDVLDLYGDKGRGARGSDLREGKISVLVIEHLASTPADAEWLWALLAAPREQTSSAQIDEAIRRFRSGGALSAAVARIEREAAAVLESPALATVPGLWALAAALVDNVLTPIAHIMAEHGVAGYGAHSPLPHSRAISVSAAEAMEASR